MKQSNYILTKERHWLRGDFHFAYVKNVYTALVSLTNVGIRPSIINCRFEITSSQVCKSKLGLMPLLDFERRGSAWARLSVWSSGDSWAPQIKLTFSLGSALAARAHFMGGLVNLSFYLIFWKCVFKHQSQIYPENDSRQVRRCDHDKFFFNIAFLMFFFSWIAAYPSFSSSWLGSRWLAGWCRSFSSNGEALNLVTLSFCPSG